MRLIMHVSYNNNNHSTRQKLINTFWSRIIERHDPKNDGIDILRLKTQKKKKIFVALYIKYFLQSFFMLLCFCTSQTNLWEK